MQKRATNCPPGKDTISHLNFIFMLTSFISVFVESIRNDEFSKTYHRCGRHQKGCSTTWNFFLAANWDIVQREMSNSLDASRGASYTTIKPHPYLKACGFLFSFVSFSLASKKIGLPEKTFQSEWWYTKTFGNYVCVSSYVWMWRAPHSWLRGYNPLFHTRLICHLSKTEGYLA